MIRVGPGEQSSRLQAAWLCQEELLNLMLVELSHREESVRGAVLLVDAACMNSQHASILPYLRQASVMYYASSLLCALPRPSLICVRQCKRAVAVHAQLSSVCVCPCGSRSPPPHS